MDRIPWNPGLYNAADRRLSIRDVVFGENQRGTWNLNDSFVRAAASRCWEVRNGICCDVAPDDREITGLKLEDVRATVQERRLPSIGVRVGADASFEHAGNLTIVRSLVK